VTTGYNYRMSDIHAAIGIVQLKKVSRMISERKKIADIYRKKLKDVPWLKLPQEDIYCKSNWQSYPVRILDNAPLSRNEIMQRLLDNGISTRRGIINAHQEKAYTSNISLESSELALNSVILLPIFNGITKKEIVYIINRIKEIA